MSIRRPPVVVGPRPPLVAMTQVKPAPVTEEEWAALAARHKSASDRLNQLIASADKSLWWERAYPVDVDLPLFTGSSTDGGYPASIGVINIELGTTFYVLGLEAPYTCTGVLSEDDSPATLTIPETLRPSIMDYTWTIRDSSTDRDWCNIPLPSAVIRTGNLGMFGLNAQAKLSGGTRVTVTVNQTFFDANSEASGLKTFSSHSLQFVLTGISVKDGAL